MNRIALIEPPSSADAPGAHRRASHLSDADEPLVGLPPLLGFVPVAGPPVFAYLGFGVVLLLLLVFRSRSSPPWSQSRSSWRRHSPPSSDWPL
jgi:hypothetical protein